MICQVVCNDYVLHDSRFLDSNLKLIDPVLTREIGKVGTFNFEIYPNHLYFDKLIPFLYNIEIIRDDNILFRGRIINFTQGIYLQKKIECESSLAFLNDSIIEPYTFEGTPEELFNYLLTEHNKQVTGNQQLKIGRVTVTDPNNYIRRYWENYTSTLELLNSRCVDSLGGYLVERYEKDGTYIDWLADFEKIANQEIVFGENLIDIISKNDGSESYSVIIPLGATTENEEGLSKTLTIENVNEGKNYLIDQNSYEKIGWVVAPISETTWNDITDASNLLKKGQEYLKNSAVGFQNSIELTAADLKTINVKIDSFFIYQYINIKSSFHNIDEKILLTSITIPLDHPENINISLNKTNKSMTSLELGNQKNANDLIKRVGKIESDYVPNKELPSIVDQQILNSSLIQQLPDRIIERVSEVYITTSEANDKFLDINDKLNNFASNSEVSELIKNVEETITATERTTRIIEEIQENGVSKVKTETGYTFNQDGMNIEKTGAPTSSNIDEAGFAVRDTTGATKSVQSYTGYVDEEIANEVEFLAPYVGTTVNYARNFLVDEYLAFNNWRIEETINPIFGKGIGFIITRGED